MRRAVHLEGGVLRRGDDVVHADLLGQTGQCIAAVGTTGAADDAGASQLEHDLLVVVAGEALLRRDLAPRDRPLVDSMGQVKGTDEAVFSLSSDPHGSNVLRPAQSG
jgi:hypothetical protein